MSMTSEAMKIEPEDGRRKFVYVTGKRWKWHRIRCTTDEKIRRWIMRIATKASTASVPSMWMMMTLLCFVADTLNRVPSVQLFMFTRAEEKKRTNWEREGVGKRSSRARRRVKLWHSCDTEWKFILRIFILLRRLSVIFHAQCAWAHTHSTFPYLVHSSSIPYRSISMSWKSIKNE